MTRAAPSLRRQILASFLGFAACVSLLFALCSFLVAYVVEDALFEANVAAEVARQQAAWRETGRLAASGAGGIQVHAGPDTFPPDLRRAFLRSGPREEYAGGEGRHYHVSPFRLDGGGSAYAVAEVGSRLAVRPLRGELLLAILAGAVAILLAAAALGCWLAARATAPLGRLVRAVSGGEAGQVPRVSAADFPDNEVGILATTLEAMLDRTRAFVERESRFTREASHELRTPLAVIRSSAELIDSRGEVSDDIARPLRRIADAARQMEQSVELLMMLAREERAASAGGDAPLLPLIERIVIAESARFAADGSHVAVRVAEEARLSVPESVAAAIIGNLVGNAFRHAAGAPVEIAAEDADLVIRDSGPGIAADVLAAPGLGLSIVGRLCRLHAIPFTLGVAPDGGTLARVGLLRAAA